MKNISVNQAIHLSEKTSDKKKGPRKCLQTLQPGADFIKNKENLVGSGRSQEKLKDLKKAKPLKKLELEISLNDMKSKENEMSLSKTNPNLYKKLVFEDLVSTVGPSEKYWEVIAERRRKALQNALKENQRLKATVMALSGENVSCKRLLEETTDLVNTLKEILEDESTEEKSD
ncbi:geminin-like [Adelges cooleyi]|uniref:geminin-like n=1 Tax=Adelges cooleyi TaxID=133065 RepID=UPI0021802675|nr:geminin-like [Adelges cooleyi]XP_050439449.1 geminin-like [Adelges cooleyi]